MMRCGDNNHHMNNGYEKEMDPSSDVNDPDEDESNNSIVHEPLEEPSSENLFMDVNESECNIVNETLSQSDSSDVPTNVITELNYDDHIEPSESVKEASYFNIFECGRNLLDQLDVTYQCAFTASETSSAVPTGHYKPSPAPERYYDIPADIITEKNVGMDRDKIREAISHVKLEDEAYHGRNIEILTQEDDNYKSPWKGYATGLNAVMNSSDSGEITFKNPAAKKEPIKDTQTLKEPIRRSHLGKRVRQSESGSTEMEAVVTELDFIGRGGPQAIIRGIYTQSIIQGMENIVFGDVITHMLTNPTQVLLESDSFSFNPHQAKTLMVTSLVESLLASNGNVL